ncbi:hypothetical protein N7530_005038 [Penicillium desertorum]|uniref:Uncharacterized protein n=1 Tax=Penicillium desertorum TaxID=1303715 RepID=A0A9W9WZ76_9EURO|nr:hypothetical protein N7530_005038 [Penicillium desertorum]
MAHLRRSDPGVSSEARKRSLGGQEDVFTYIGKLNRARQTRTSETMKRQLQPGTSYELYSVSQMS